MPSSTGPSEDVARLSPFVRQHITMLGRYPFRLPICPAV